MRMLEYNISSEDILTIIINQSLAYLGIIILYMKKECIMRLFGKILQSFQKK